jgi:hypothetical protein
MKLLDILIPTFRFTTLQFSSSVLSFIDALKLALIETSSLIFTMSILVKFIFKMLTPEIGMRNP